METNQAATACGVVAEGCGNSRVVDGSNVPAAGEVLFLVSNRGLRGGHG